jgi:hypothetical protein
MYTILTLLDWGPSQPLPVGEANEESRMRVISIQNAWQSVREPSSQLNPVELSGPTLCMNRKDPYHDDGALKSAGSGCNSIING